MYDINKSKMTDTDGMTLCASVVNRLEIKGEKNRVKEILTAIRGECEIIDYRTMLPCPPVPEKEVGEPEREAAAAYLLAANPDSEDLGIEKLCAEDFKKISFAFLILGALCRLVKAKGLISMRQSTAKSLSK